jgi:hypothetical protein
MKLRIRGGSIRLRLGRSEVLRVLQEGIVEEFTVFDAVNGRRLAYALVSDADISQVAATFEDGRVAVHVPRGLIREWGTTDRLSIEARQPIDEATSLRILIEKDLECLDAPAEESQEDMFPRDEQSAACPPRLAGARAAADRDRLG